MQGVVHFYGVQDLQELKFRYRRLASRHHPDRGGNEKLMTQINIEYQALMDFLKSGLSTRKPEPAKRKPQPAKPKPEAKAQKPQARQKVLFERVKIGDTVYVNGTECEVMEVSDSSFRVTAKGRSRQAWFRKECGTGRYNRCLRASWQPNGRSYH